mmetsp:Transcript_16536/g.45796  ORF Transcript_16536/g.45796 Transcript_16536/m.45796 type:complete len:109 (-) Transcript_16536:762-1088(-)
MLCCDHNHETIVSTESSFHISRYIRGDKSRLQPTRTYWLKSSALHILFSVSRRTPSSPFTDHLDVHANVHAFRHISIQPSNHPPPSWSSSHSFAPGNKLQSHGAPKYR